MTYFETKGREDNTALHYAITSNNIEIIEKLIDLGANIEAKNEHGQTPFFLAIQLRLWPVFNLLLQKGADID